MENITSEILQWYQSNQRNLPWRKTDNPYFIWLSEIILQQTRVSQGLPYYRRFIKSYPDLASLAAASESEVLREWQGLGYYSRARNMLNCAREVQERYNGIFPKDYEQLMALPGIGSYTAAAVASIAFKQPVAVVDGNVIRVLSRLFGIRQVPTSGNGKKIFQNQAQLLLAKDQPDQFNQAIMEFGALQCTPHPHCDRCPLSRFCHAYKNDKQQDFPLKPKKVRVIPRYFNYLVIMLDGQILMRQRDKEDIWRGLYDFYLVESPEAWDSKDLIGDKKGLEFLSHPEVGIDDPMQYKHKLSHQCIFAVFYRVDISSQTLFRSLAIEHELQIFSQQEIQRLPKSILVANFLKERIF